MRNGRLKDPRTIITLIAAMSLMVAAGVVILTRHSGSSDTTTIGVLGGTATSTDGQVSVTFSPGELAADTSIHMITDDRSAPPPPAGVVPAAPPFSITPAGDGSHQGSVTVQAPKLPDGVDPSTMVMMVSEGSGWRALETAVDPTTHAVTAYWPHFSKGFIGVPGWIGDAFNAAKNGTKQAAQWSWDNFKDGLAVVGRATKELTAKLAALTVGMLGGTLEHPHCDTSAEEWKVTAQAPNELLPSALEACIEEREPNGSWKMKVVNHFPFPFMLKLPPNVSVNWDQLINEAEYPIEDAVIATAEGMLDRTMVYGGKTLEIEIHGNANPTLDLNGFIDPISMGLKAIMLALTVFTAGESTAAMESMHSVLDLEVKALVEAQVRSGDSLMSEVVSQELWNNAVQRSARAEEIEKTVTLPGAADLYFTAMDLVNCGLGVYHYFTEEDEAPPAGSSAELGERVTDTNSQTSLGHLVNECFTSAILAVFKVLNLINPSSSFSNPEELVKALGEQVLSAVRVSMTQTALEAAAVTGVNYVQTGLHLQRSEAQSEPSGGAGSDTGPSTPSSTAPTTPGSTQPLQALPRNFTTPEGDIRCAENDEGDNSVYCIVHDGSLTSKKCEPLRFELITLDITGEAFNGEGCVSAEWIGRYMIGANPLPAGTVGEVSAIEGPIGISCTVGDQNVSCTNREGRGFSLTPSEFRPT